VYRWQQSFCGVEFVLTPTADYYLVAAGDEPLGKRVTDTACAARDQYCVFVQFHNRFTNYNRQRRDLTIFLNYAPRRN
jgi:hypothetical protein